MSEEKTHDQLQQELAEANKKNEELVVENELLAEQNENLKAEVKRLLDTPHEKESETGVGKTFELKGSKYKVLSSSINIPGIGKLTAADILASKDAQEWLVEKKSGAIAEVK